MYLIGHQLEFCLFGLLAKDGTARSRFPQIQTWPSAVKT